MKMKVFAAFILALLCSFAARGQDFQNTYEFLSPRIAGPGSGQSFANTGITSFAIFWTPQVTVSSCAVQVDSSSDGVTWGTGDLIATQNCATVGSTTATSLAAGKNYVRVNVTGLGGNGSVIVTIKGWGGGSSSSGGTSVGCTSNCPYVLTTADQQWVQASAGFALSTINVPQFVKFYNNATRGLGNACIRITTASAGGHASVSVYTLTGTLAWTTGAFSTTSATSLCFTPTPTTLVAGTPYYLSWCADNTTAVLAAAANTTISGFTVNAGAPAHTFGVDSAAGDTCTAGAPAATIAPANIANTNTAMIVPYVQVFL